MDDFLEHMLSTSSWGEGAFGMINKDMAIDSAVAGTPGLPKLPPAMPALIPPSGALGTLESRAIKRLLQEGAAGGDMMFESSQGQPQDSSHMMRPPPRLGHGGGNLINASSSQSLTLVSESSRGPQVLSNNYDSAALPHNLPPVMASAWRQPYIPPVPSLLVRTKSDTFRMLEEVPNDAHLGKRMRDEEDLLTENNLGNMIHVAQTQGFPDQSTVAQDPNALAANGAVRPRVRARRGQATDPHSIAERNRRERIAERMKALQELVPDSNKTDKASMLDEIIGYVRFLQMQVKCLSMCRLGGAGAASSFLADLPSEEAGTFLAANLAQSSGVTGPSQEGMALAERQVARLMDEDMSAAMQYLQSKGLCLMPISLATAISSTGARHAIQLKPDESGLMKQAAEVQVPAAASESVVNMPTVNVNTANNAIVKDDVHKPGTDMAKSRQDDTNENVSNLPPLVQKGTGPQE